MKELLEKTVMILLPIAIWIVIIIAVLGIFGTVFYLF